MNLTEPLLRDHHLPKLCEGQHVGEVDGHTYYYNPQGYGGVTVVNRDTVRLLAACDGTRTVQDVATIDGRPRHIVCEELEALARAEVVALGPEIVAILHEAARAATARRLSCWVHLTNSCNLACTYCYIHKSKGTMSRSLAEATIDRLLESCRANNLTTLDLKLAGGEPLSRFTLVRHIVEYARATCGDVAVTFTVLTNGVLITDPVAEWLVENRIGVAVSLDGAAPAHDRTRIDRQGRGSFGRVMDGIDRLQAAGKRPSIMTTVTDSNYDQLPELTTLAIERGWRFRFSLERDSADNGESTLRNMEGLTASLHECYDYVEAHLPSTDFLTLHRFGDAQFRKPARKACGAATSFGAVGHDGALGVCGMGLAHPYGKLGDGDFLSSLRDRNVGLFLHRAAASPDCSTCTWRSSCAGGCPLQTQATYGTFAHSSPYCAVYRSILPRIVRIRAMQLVRAAERRKEVNGCGDPR